VLAGRISIGTAGGFQADQEPGEVLRELLTATIAFLAR
jgi:hypothetical protein